MEYFLGALGLDSEAWAKGVQVSAAVVSFGAPNFVVVKTAEAGAAEAWLWSRPADSV